MSKYFSAPLQKIRSLVNTLADLFFPFICFGCGKADTWLCHSCSLRIPGLLSQRCFQCQNTPTRYGEACYQCQHTQPLDAVFSATCYHVPVIKKMLHTYKYHFVASLSLPLGTILAKRVEESLLPLPHLLVPVPLHSKRLRYRGFNQSALLCAELTGKVSALSGIPVTEAVQRIRFTKPQQKTHSREERTQNLAGSFQVAPGAEVAHKTLWLVDDVATTHSTLTECARVLKEAGAKKVYAVVLAQD